MNRAALVAAGAVAIAAAVALRGAGGDVPASADPFAALGGARVLLVDALFLRAEAHRAAGRLEEAAADYRRVLDADPLADASADRLADVLAYDLRLFAPTAEGRVRWWQEAERVVLEAIRRRPDSALLRWRAGDLLLSVPSQDEAVATHLAHASRDRSLEGLRRLLEAARLANEIPRRGYLHLATFVATAPRVAAERLASGGGADEVLAMIDEVLRLRESALREFTLDDRPTPPPPPTAADRLRGGLRVVREVRARVAAGDRADARSLLDTYASALGQDAVWRALDAFVAR